MEAGREGERCLLESAVLTPCLAWWELSSRSAWRAMAMGSWPSYSLDMVEDVLSMISVVRRRVFVGSGLVVCGKKHKMEIRGWN